MSRMKKAGFLVGLMMLAPMAGCAFVLGSDGGPDPYVANPRATVRLLHEKLGYLRQIEHNLRDSLAAAKASPSTTEDEARAMTVELLEARVNRVDVQLEIARWLRPMKKLEGDKAKGDKAKADKAKSDQPKADQGSK